MAEKQLSTEFNNGHIYVSLIGQFAVGERAYRYHVIPSDTHGQPLDGACLGSRQKWGKLGPAGKVALLSSPAIDSLSEIFQGYLEGTVIALLQEAYAKGLDLKDCSDALLAFESKTHTFFERLTVARDRIDAAVQRKNLDKMAERTKAAISLADYPGSFGVARNMKRKFIALLGEPNSGKTYEAMQALIKAKSGVYLAPLRLLALENYEKLVESGVKASMVTGEECRLNEGATHISSTIEMLDFRKAVEVAVVDEFQVIDDDERGSSWTAALCGAPANTVYIVGSLTAEGAVIELAKRLGVELEIKKMLRKGELIVERKPVRELNQLQKGDALIAFSRKDVLQWRETLTDAGITSAAVYGNLSPEVRRAQAKLFREEKVDVLIGTDALAMGLNMPIKRVIFTTSEKFDGVETKEIPAWLAQQIGGRAGRFGIHEKGMVSAVDEDCLAAITDLMRTKLTPIRTRGFWVAPTIEHLETLQEATGSDKLFELLLQFKKNIDIHDSFFLPASLTDQVERSGWLDSLNLTLEEKFLLSLVPLSLHVSLHAASFETWARNLSAKQPTRLTPPVIRLDDSSLQLAEDTCKLFSGYAWLSYRKPEYFPDGELAIKWVRQMSESIDLYFQQTLAVRRDQSVKAKRSREEREGMMFTSSLPGDNSRREKKTRDEKRSAKATRLQQHHEAAISAHQENVSKNAMPSAETRLSARQKMLALLNS